jgi:hypothetical protein
MSEKEEVRIELPSYLAEFLRKFSKELAMTPSQLIANLLNYYYEAWRIGARAALEERGAAEEGKALQPVDLKSLLASFEREHGKKYKYSSYVIKHFIDWIQRKKSPVTIDEIGGRDIDLFLDEYAQSRKVKPSTISNYRTALRKFLEFAKASQKSGSV